MSDMRFKILVVDDSFTDQLMIQSILDDYELQCACNGAEALEVLQNDPDVELMILDLNMPVMNGFEVLQKMAQNPEYKRIATLILTNVDEVDKEIKGLELGAVDYIRKPLNIAALRKRIEIHRRLITTRRALEEHNERLEQTVEERTRELVLIRDTTIHALIGLLEARDIESSNHIRRTQWMMKALCEHLSGKDGYRDILTDSYIQELFSTAPLHDIGKVGIPDGILLKPGALTDSERKVMQQHTTIGVNALRYETETKEQVAFLQIAIEIIGWHHEWYNGEGYPDGLKGDEIPLSARLMAIIDVYDALISKRVYKPAFPHEEALRIIADQRGIHFDPNLVDAFLEIDHTIREIAMKYYQRGTGE